MNDGDRIIQIIPAGPDWYSEHAADGELHHFPIGFWALVEDSDGRQGVWSVAPGVCDTLVDFEEETLTFKGYVHKSEREYRRQRALHIHLRAKRAPNAAK